MWQDLKVLGSIKFPSRKDPDGTVLVKTVDMGRERRVDVRLFVSKGDGTTTHTQQGFAFTPAQAKECIKLLTAAVKDSSLKG